jgi:Rieske Fe-S protein
MHYSRRQFLDAGLKAVCLVPAGILVACLEPSMATQIPSSIDFDLRKSEYNVLQDIGGSVYVPYQYNGNIPSLILTRVSDDKIEAVSATCTHEGCEVQPFNPALNVIQCPCHGSEFAVDGRLVQGPAGDPLPQYRVSFDGDVMLTVHFS